MDGDGARRNSRRWRASWLVAGLVACVLWGLNEFFVQHESPLSAVVVAVVWGVGQAGAVYWRERRQAKKAGLSGVGELEDLGEDIRTGRVPDDPESRRRLREMVDKPLNRSRRVFVGAWVGLVAMPVALAVLWGLTDGPLVGVCVGLGGLALLGWLAWATRRNLRRLRRMRARLDAAGVAGVASGAR